MTDVPELTEAQLARAIPARVRRRLMQGRFESGNAAASCRSHADTICRGHGDQRSHPSKLGTGPTPSGRTGDRSVANRRSASTHHSRKPEVSSSTGEAAVQLTGLEQTRARRVRRRITVVQAAVRAPRSGPANSVLTSLPRPRLSQLKPRPVGADDGEQDLTSPVTRLYFRYEDRNFDPRRGLRGRRAPRSAAQDFSKSIVQPSAPRVCGAALPR